MENKSSSNKRNSFSNESNLKKGIEIHSNKIIPHFEKRNTRRFFKEDEWDQEYYIIYNSYALEEKDAES
jgi:hypothetical protein